MTSPHAHYMGAERHFEKVQDSLQGIRWLPLRLRVALWWFDRELNRAKNRELFRYCRKGRARYERRQVGRGRGMS